MNRHTAAVLRHGEVFTDEQGRTLKGSVKASTRATFSLANRMCFYEGLIQDSLIVGEYLTRQIDGKIFMINTLQPQPKSPELDFVFMAQCNQVVTLARPVGVDAGSDRVTEWNIYAEDIQVFMDTTTRSLKEQNDGLMPQDITIIHIPTRYGIKKLDRVYLVRKGVPLGKSEYYRVESINEALTPLDELVDFSGVDVMQLTEDKRMGDIKDDSGDTGTEPTEPDDGGWW